MIFGREAELAELARLLEGRGGEVLLLTGAAGIGKSSVAAAIPEEEHGPRVARCDLAEADREEIARDAIAAAVGASDFPSARRALAESGAVLVLDNADALALAPLCRALSGVTLVVTSRSRIGVGERVIELGPLAPEPALAMLERAAELRGTRLDDRALAAQLVHELEGLPLAIELAAARLSVMNVRALLHRLRASAGRAGPRPLGGHRVLDPGVRARGARGPRAVHGVSGRVHRGERGGDRAGGGPRARRARGARPALARAPRAGREARAVLGRPRGGRAAREGSGAPRASRRALRRAGRARGARVAHGRAREPPPGHLRRPRRRPRDDQARGAGPARARRRAADLGLVRAA